MAIMPAAMLPSGSGNFNEAAKLPLAGGAGVLVAISTPPEDDMPLLELTVTVCMLRTVVVVTPFATVETSAFEACGRFELGDWETGGLFAVLDVTNVVAVKVDTVTEVETVADPDAASDWLDDWRSDDSVSVDGRPVDAPAIDTL